MTLVSISKKVVHPNDNLTSSLVYVVESKQHQCPYLMNTTDESWQGFLHTLVTIHRYLDIYLYTHVLADRDGYRGSCQGWKRNQSLPVLWLS
jgi:hypothetical protein